jgi:hypothetical protein
MVTSKTASALKTASSRKRKCRARQVDFAADWEIKRLGNKKARCFGGAGLGPTVIAIVINASA